MTKEDIISKIKKCMRLSESGNEHEAALAASRARELMDKYNLSVSSFEEVDDSPGQKGEIDRQAKIPPWKQALFSQLSKLYDTVPYFSRGYGEKKTGGKVVSQQIMMVIGYEKDIELVRYTYTFLARTIEKLVVKERNAEKHRYGSWSRRDSYLFTRSFCSGAVSRIIEKIKEQRDNTLQASVETRDLVICRKDNVKKWVDDNMEFGKTRKITSSNLDSGFYNKGVEAGNNINLNPGVTGSSNSRQEIR
ncbi:MAG: DUF2786 domain-containing protein [PVC group bacterium]|nr:DUF2786 domain-containing protein [PVC group bacterium]